MEEFELVDIEGNKTGTIINGKEFTTVDCIPEGEYLQVVKIVIINDDKKLLFQRRSINRAANPGKWGLTGGKVNAGEDTISAAIRETYEEIGIKLNKEELKYVCKYNTEKAIFTLYYVKKDIEIEDCKIQTEEVNKLRYFSIDELDKLGEIEGKEWLEELKSIL